MKEYYLQTRMLSKKYGQTYAVNKVNPVIFYQTGICNHGAFDETSR